MGTKRNPVRTAESLPTKSRSRVQGSKASRSTKKAILWKSTSGPKTTNQNWPGDTSYDDLDEEEFMDDIPREEL